MVVRLNAGGGAAVIAILLGLAAALSGCADNAPLIDDYLGGGAGVDPAFVGPPLIRRADATGTTYPNLGTVPARPTDFDSAEAVQTIHQRLTLNIQANAAAARALEKVAPPPVGGKPNPDNAASVWAAAPGGPPVLPNAGGDIPPAVDAVKLPDAPVAVPKP